MNSQKELFSLKENTHYLNCAYKAPLLKSAEEACIKALIRERNPSDIKPDDFFDEAEQVRSYFGQLINAHTSQIAIVPSVSYGMSSVMSNTKAKVGGNAITVKEEFPSGYYALEKWCKQHNNELSIVHPGDTNLIGESWNANILNSIDEQTSVVLLSSVHWMNGIKFDLEAIGKKCKQVGAKFIVDGSQSVGAMEMDIDFYHIDALICAGYKWLFGPYSLSLVYLSEYYNEGYPIEETWMNRIQASTFSDLNNYKADYKPGAARYNVGQTSNLIAMPILLESLKQLNKWEPNHIQNYCAKLITPLITYLKNLGVEIEGNDYFCSHLFSLQLPSEVDTEILKENLFKNNVFVSVRGPYLRVSVNVFNDEKDISKLITVIAETLNTNNNEI